MDAVNNGQEVCLPMSRYSDSFQRRGHGCRGGCGPGAARGWPCSSRATTRRPPSLRWSPTSARRCPRRRSTSTTTTPPTAPRTLPRRAGAVVRRESRQGKGNVVRSMFRDIDAEYYLMVDGDDTYPAEAARRPHRAPGGRRRGHDRGRPHLQRRLRQGERAALPQLRQQPRAPAHPASSTATPSRTS